MTEDSKVKFEPTTLDDPASKLGLKMATEILNLISRKDMEAKVFYLAVSVMLAAIVSGLLKISPGATEDEVLDILRTNAVNILPLIETDYAPPDDDDETPSATQH